MRFWIVGAGMGSEAGLTGEAREALAASGLVLASAQRLAAVWPGAEDCPFGELAARALAAPCETVALLVSGDVGFFSAAGRLRETLAPHGEVRLLPGLSSLQVLCARVGAAYQDAHVLSLHGRKGDPVSAVCYHAKTFVLTDGARDGQTICRTLCEAGLGGVRVSIGERLGASDERVRTDTAAALAAEPCDALAVLLVENEQAADARRALRDDDFVRGKVPMTKQEVRWTAVNLLAVQPGDTVWDVGAGTGSVSIELGYRACAGTVWAVERGEEGLALIEENRRRLGAFNVRPVAGSAPAALEALPAPDAVFIGGSGGKLDDIVRLSLQKNPAVRICVSAIALETLLAAMEALRAAGLEPEVCQIAASRGRRVAAYTMLTANNPVFLICGGGR